MFANLLIALGVMLNVNLIKLHKDYGGDTYPLQRSSLSLVKFQRASITAVSFNQPGPTIDGSTCRSATFNGNGYLKGFVTLNPANGYTISTWLKCGQQVTNSGAVYVAALSGSEGVYIDRDSGRVMFLTMNDWTVQEIVWGPVVTDGQWHHVTVTRGSGTMGMIVDGTEYQSTAEPDMLQTVGVSTGKNPVYIGGIGLPPFPGSFCFTGSIAYVSVFNAAGVVIQ